MPTQAIAAYGVQVKLGDGVPLAAISVTGGTATTPIVLTTAAHGIATGDVSTGTVTGVTGLTGANGTWLVEATDATHLRLRGTVGGGAYSGGGTFTRTSTYTTIAEMTDVQDAGLMATTINVTAHDGNGYGSNIPTFLRGNTMRMALNWVPANPQHNATTGLSFLLTQRITRPYLVVWPSHVGVPRPAWYFSAWTTEDRKAAPVAGALTSAIQFEVDGPLIFTTG